MRILFVVALRLLQGHAGAGHAGGDANADEPRTPFAMLTIGNGPGPQPELLGPYGALGDLTLYGIPPRAETLMYYSFTFPRSGRLLHAWVHTHVQMFDGLWVWAASPSQLGMNGMGFKAAITEAGQPMILYPEVSAAPAARPEGGRTTANSTSLVAAMLAVGGERLRCRGHHDSYTLERVGQGWFDRRAAVTCHDGWTFSRGEHATLVFLNKPKRSLGASKGLLDSTRRAWGVVSEAKPASANSADGQTATTAAVTSKATDYFTQHSIFRVYYTARGDPTTDECLLTDESVGRIQAKLAGETGGGLLVCADAIIRTLAWSRRVKSDDRGLQHIRAWFGSSNQTNGRKGAQAFFFPIPVPECMPLDVASRAIARFVSNCG
jgi:hypothetical protein